jgi:hypothetical protein
MPAIRQISCAGLVYCLQRGVMVQSCSLLKPTVMDATHTNYNCIICHTRQQLCQQTLQSSRHCDAL